MENETKKITPDFIAGAVAIIAVIVMIFINSGKTKNESNQDRRGPVESTR